MAYPNFKNRPKTALRPSGVKTTTSYKQKWGKYLNQYNFFLKNTTLLAPTTTKGAKLRKTKCEA
jgi:hypothetical protein